MVDNIEPIVKFIFCDLASPCLVLGQEASDELLDENGMPVPKFRGGDKQQFLKPQGWHHYVRGGPSRMVEKPKEHPSLWMITLPKGSQPP